MVCDICNNFDIFRLIWCERFSFNTYSANKFRYCGFNIEKSIPEIRIKKTQIYFTNNSADNFTGPTLLIMGEWLFENIRPLNLLYYNSSYCCMLFFSYSNNLHKDIFWGEIFCCIRKEVKFRKNVGKWS